MAERPLLIFVSDIHKDFDLLEQLFRSLERLGRASGGLISVTLGQLSPDNKLAEQ